MTLPRIFREVPGVTVRLMSDKELAPLPRPSPGGRRSPRPSPAPELHKRRGTGAAWRAEPRSPAGQSREYTRTRSTTAAVLGCYLPIPYFPLCEAAVKNLTPAEQARRAAVLGIV